LIMAMGYRPVDRDQQFLLPLDMREWLPSSHLVWFVIETVEQFEPPWKRRRVLIRQRRLSTMASPRKYDQEFRERAVRMYSERLAEPGESKRGARRHVGALLDLNPETLRNWAEERDRVESGRSPAPRSAEAEEVRTLRRRVAELERANEILKTSAAFFAQAELDRRLR
jgi:transposase-like protein